MKTLNDLVDGQSARIGSYEPTLSAARRLMELGLMPGVTVRFIKSAPLGDPIALDVEGRQLSLRREDAARILVQPV
ncbi:MAG: ferrous iron transport protein A [Opitutales bacterium TMED158]|nr:MAG: ferrous iron transport protein A [Opitutales bacterium TMED158]